MKKNVLFWIGVKSKNKLLREKHGDFKYFEIFRKFLSIALNNQ